MLFSLPVLLLAGWRELGVPAAETLRLIERLVRLGALVELRLPRGDALYGRDVESDPTIAIVGFAPSRFIGRAASRRR